jgi:murein L,D-transpeptidase YcbB/YkuD
MVLRWLFLVLAFSIPAGAAAQTVESISPVAKSSPDLGIDAFYGTRNSEPLWLKDEVGRLAATRIVALLRDSAIDGLSDGVTLARAVDAAIQGGTPADDKLISSAWVSYIRALNSPVDEVSYGDSQRKPKSLSAVAILHAAAEAPSLSEYVERTSAVNPLYQGLRAAALQSGSPGDPPVA